MATSSNLGPTQGPILLGKNYVFWFIRMRSFLLSQECWYLLNLGYLEPDLADLVSMTNQQRTTQEIQMNRENKSQLCINNSVDDSIFPKITVFVTSK